QDAPEDLEEGRAVDLGCTDQFGREGFVVVAEEQRREAEPVDGMDQDKARYGAGETEQPKYAGGRDQHDLERDEAGKQHQAKNDRVAAKAPSRQHVAVERAEDG